jgi:hypothetical protein
MVECRPKIRADHDAYWPERPMLIRTRNVRGGKVGRRPRVKKNRSFANKIGDALRL